MKKDKKNRRQFLKNSTLLALSATTVPALLKADGTLNNDDSLLCDPTTLDAYGQGPFYTSGPPDLIDGQLAPPSEPGQRMIITGRVHNLDCTEYIPNAKIDIWHANDAGDYDNVGYHLRGVTYSNGQGFYMFESIVPGKYLNGGSFRPSHVHFKITAPGFDEFITQLYFEGDPEIPGDFAASMTSGTYDATHRIIPLSMNANNIMEGTWDIVLNAEGTPVGTSDLHSNKGVIYRAYPNPFSERLNIRYGVFNRSRVKLLVFDLQGRQVAQLEENEMYPEQYDAVWQPDPSTPNGYYFIALQINDIQVNYMKVVLQR